MKIFLQCRVTFPSHVLFIEINAVSLCQQFRSLCSQAGASSDYLRFAILKMNLNKSSHWELYYGLLTYNNITDFAFQSPQCYPVLNITCKSHDQLPRKLTTLTNGTATGKFDILFGQPRFQSDHLAPSEVSCLERQTTLR